VRAEQWKGDVVLLSLASDKRDQELGRKRTLADDGVRNVRMRAAGTEPGDAGFRSGSVGGNGVRRPGGMPDNRLQRLVRGLGTRWAVVFPAHITFSASITSRVYGHNLDMGNENHHAILDQSWTTSAPSTTA
jgi:hypothetical protein